jgi:uncharacterized protein (DUF1501 family)
VASEAGVAAVRISLNGFDTHQGQPATHAHLPPARRRACRARAAASSALTDARRHLCRVRSQGAGERLQQDRSRHRHRRTSRSGAREGQAVRRAPRLDRPGGNLSRADFRSVYATVLERWRAAAGALGGQFAPLDLPRPA